METPERTGELAASALPSKQGTALAICGRVADSLASIELPDDSAFNTLCSRHLELCRATAFRLARQNDGQEPVIALVFGPSGGGKSSLFNALLRREKSRTSSIERPSTKGAVCAIAQELSEENLEVTLFPTLKHRTSKQETETGDFGSVVFFKDESLHRLVLVDCPDFDTQFSVNKEAATRIQYWADLILFVTSTERYADRSATEFLESMATLAPKFYAVLNKIEGDPDEILAEFRSQILLMGGPEPEDVVGIPRGAEGLDPDAMAVTKIRDLVRATTPSRRPDLDLVFYSIEREILPVLRDWRTEVAELCKDLDGLRKFVGEFETDRSLGALERLEEAGKFWLRYSPRGVLRGLKSVLATPSSIFKANPPPEGPDDDRLDAVINDQAWEIMTVLQIRSRETLQSRRVGRLLIAKGELQDVEFNAEKIAIEVSGISQRLREFGRTKLANLRQELKSADKNFVAKLRIWALDKILRLMCLCLTLALLPPLVWELLRIIGHPSFTNEVAQEIRDTKAIFQAELRRLGAAQIQAYESALEKIGPSQRFVNELKTRLKAMGELVREGNS